MDASDDAATTGKTGTEETAKMADDAAKTTTVKTGEATDGTSAVGDADSKMNNIDTNVEDPTSVLEAKPILTSPSTSAGSGRGSATNTGAGTEVSPKGDNTAASERKTAPGVGAGGDQGSASNTGGGTGAKTDLDQ